MRDDWFVAVAAAVLVVTVGTAVVAATNGLDDGDGTIDAWAPDLPDVHAVEAPTEPGVATVGDREFASLEAALEAVGPGDTIRLEGRFDERVTVETPGVTIEAVSANGAVIDGGGAGTVVTVVAENVTLDDVWIRNSGHERASEDAGVLVQGSGTTLTQVRLTEITFGVWIGEAEGVTVERSTIVGRSDVGHPLRGNGIHLDRADGAVLRDNYVTTVRDGIYYSWSDGVVSERNVLWDLRYGVHYMYSEDNRLVDNVAFDNDVGFALMVSSNLTIAHNVAVANDGASGQGILVKDVDDSVIRENAVVANGNGIYVYNAHGNAIEDNLVLENAVGLHFTAGSTGERVTNNSFIGNAVPAHASTNAQLHWNTSDRGNYWSAARTVDVDGDGVSAVRYRPTGVAEALVHDRPQAAAFAESPAFDAVRLAESSFPVVEAPGVVDHRPLVDPPHEDWREYYATHDH